MYYQYDLISESRHIKVLYIFDKNRIFIIYKEHIIVYYLKSFLIMYEICFGKNLFKYGLERRKAGGEM